MEANSLNYERVAQAIRYIQEHFREQPDLMEVARQVHLSPEHFQKMFSEWAGVSPKKFMQFLTLDHLRTRIRHLPNLQEAAAAVGLSTQSRVYDLFVNIEGVTPGIWRTGGEGLTIRYGYHHTPFGLCFIALGDRGICGLSFVDEAQKGKDFEAFRKQWHFAEMLHAPEATQSYVKRIFSPVKESTGNLPALHIAVQGTNFQLKVWEALLRIPPGVVSTYGEIAKSIGQPGSARAVGGAIGSNPVAYLIPCHRVIQGTGRLGGYHWGVSRKGAILGLEMALSGAG